jgi:hypothetical protein
MPTPTLKLPTCEHLDTFDVCVSVLKADYAVRSLVKTWRTWTGDPADAAEWTADQCPGIRLTPAVVDEGWMTPDSLKGRLVVDVELALAGTNLRNHALVWRAIKRAFYPAADAERTAIAGRLRTAGAYPALVFFNPGFSYSPEDGGSIVVATGRLSVIVNETLNP